MLIIKHVSRHVMMAMEEKGIAFARLVLLANAIESNMKANAILEERILCLNTAVIYMTEEIDTIFNGVGMALDQELINDPMRLACEILTAVDVNLLSSCAA